MHKTEAIYSFNMISLLEPEKTMLRKAAVYEKM